MVRDPGNGILMWVFAGRWIEHSEDFCTLCLNFPHKHCLMHYSGGRKVTLLYYTSSSASKAGMV